MKKTIFILTLLLPFGLLCAQSHIEQVGGANFVKVEQVGENNRSFVHTVGWFNAKSFVDQQGDGVNESDILEDGWGNKADVTQLNDVTEIWHENNSLIIQPGHWNSAKVDQIAVEREEWGFAQRTAVIVQTGIGNRAEIQQEGVLLFANTEQEGFGSHAKQIQGKNSYITAVGKFNDATIHQSPNATFGSRAEQYQDGQQNDAHIEQNSGFFSKAVQIQMNDKEDYEGPIFTDLNQADILQTNGVGNKATQVQYYPENDLHYGANDANLYQEGSWNHSQEVQVGGDNFSNVFQVGNGNAASVYQNEHDIEHPALNNDLPIISF